MAAGGEGLGWSLNAGVRCVRRLHRFVGVLHWVFSWYLDCLMVPTVGHGGHSLALLAAHPEATVIGIDLDAQVHVQTGILPFRVSLPPCPRLLTGTVAG